MLSNYSLYKKLEDKFENSIKEMKQESSNTYIRIITPLAVLYISKLIPDNWLFLKILIFIMGLLIVSLTFDIVKTFFASFYESSRAFIFKTWGTNTNLSEDDIDKGMQHFKNRFKELYKNLYLINVGVNSTKELERNLFLVFAEDELTEINKEIRHLKMIINDKKLSKDNFQYKNLNTLFTLYTTTIGTIKELTFLQESNVELYNRLINLEIKDISVSS